jgi:WD40 repeat protein
MRALNLLRVLSLALPFLAAPASAAPLPSEPQLVLSAGMHTAMLKSAAADQAGRFFVTVSDDKTARVFDTATGKQAGMLRPPIAPGSEGQLNAVAMSPDGKWIALAGETTAGETTGRVIYLFERATGKLSKRVGGLPGEVNKLAWSPDGKYLAALCKEGGLRVFRTRDWGNAGRDADYGAEGNDLSFSADGRLATTSMDGQIRLYGVADSAIQKIVAVKGTGRMPFGLAFSPNGNQLAVTYVDQIRVELRSGFNLGEEFVPSVQGIAKNDGGFVAVAWAPDGGILYAAGQPRQEGREGRHIARGWTDGGRGQFADLPLSDQVVMGLVALADGRVLYAAADPAWGMIFPDGKVFEVGKAPIADFRPAGKYDAFGVSADGRTVAFGYAGMAQQTASFDVEARQVSTAERPGKVQPPRQSAPGFALADWKGGEKPKLNGRVLALRAQETARSYAVAHDGSGLVLGADFTLRRFDANGKQLWETATPGIAWAVNVSADHRFAVAAYGDGTIRWHRWLDGKETLALFPHTDRKRWIVWTPSGFFDASPGGDDLFGWHLNRGKDNAADFFPASRFRDRFFHPELIARVFETADEKAALKQQAEEEKAVQKQQAAEQKLTPPAVPIVAPVKVEQVLPPVVEVVSPADGTAVSASNLTVKLRIRSDSPVTEIRARVNGQAAAIRVSGSGETREIALTIPERDVEIMFFAINRNATSTPAVLRLQWKGTAPPPPKAALPKLYLLSVGVSDYEDAEIRLDLAAKDATDFARAMREQKGTMYREIEERVLLDRKAKRGAIVDSLKWLTQNVTDDDVAVVFVAGHGMNDQRAGYYFLPADVDRRRMNETGVKSQDIVDTLSRLPGRVVAFIDTCHSGNVLVAGKGASFKRDTTKMVNELSSPEHGVIVFTSATGSQYALESPAWGNGAFTKALVEGLLGQAADQRNGNKVMHKSLEAYVGQRVTGLTKNQQTPTTISPQGVQNFPLAVKRQ